MKTGPIFILGFPRSGTTAMGRALGILDEVQEFSREGHYLYFIASMLEKLRRGQSINPASLILDEGRYQQLEQAIASAIDGFQKEIAAPKAIWVDKTPDLTQIKNTPVYYRMFPSSKYIFMYRDPLETVQSNVTIWPRIRHKTIETTKRWVETMSTWRSVRESLDKSCYVEIYQGEMRLEPANAVSMLIPLLDLSGDQCDKMVNFLSKHNVNVPKKNREKSGLTWVERRMINMLVKGELCHWPEMTK